MQRSVILRWLEAGVIVCLLGLIYLPHIDTVPFHGDESSRIASSASFEAFIQGDFDSPLWEESYWTLTQPPLSRYVIGIGRSVGGYEPSDLNRHWNWSLDDAANIKRGSLPDPGLLWWSRLPMAILTVLAGLSLFYLARALAGAVAGYVALLLYASSVYLRQTLLVAMGEAPLLVCLLLAALIAVWALPHWEEAVARRPIHLLRLRPLAGLLLVGVWSGLAGAAKLNGLAGAAAGLALVTAISLTQPGAISLKSRLAALILGGAILTGAALGAFVAVNPFLYPAPVERAIAMADHRVTEMQEQYEAIPPSRITDPAMRLSLLSERVFQTHAAWTFTGARPLNIGLTLLGLAYLLMKAWRWLWRRQTSGAATVTLAFGAVTAGPALLTPLDWPRYYLFPVIFSLLCMAAALGAGGRLLAQWRQHRLQPVAPDHHPSH